MLLGHIEMRRRMTWVTLRVRHWMKSEKRDKPDDNGRVLLGRKSTATGKPKSTGEGMKLWIGRNP